MGRGPKKHRRGAKDVRLIVPEAGFAPNEPRKRQKASRPHKGGDDFVPRSLTALQRRKERSVSVHQDRRDKFHGVEKNEVRKKEFPRSKQVPDVSAGVVRYLRALYIVSA
jgi:hypothetical protein